LYTVEAYKEFFNTYIGTKIFLMISSHNVVFLVKYIFLC